MSTFTTKLSLFLLILGVSFSNCAYNEPIAGSGTESSFDTSLLHSSEQDKSLISHGLDSLDQSHNVSATTIPVKLNESVNATVSSNTDNTDGQLLPVQNDKNQHSIKHEINDGQTQTKPQNISLTAFEGKIITQQRQVDHDNQTLSSFSLIENKSEVTETHEWITRSNVETTSALNQDHDQGLPVSTTEVQKAASSSLNTSPNINTSQESEDISLPSTTHVPSTGNQSEVSAHQEPDSVEKIHQIFSYVTTVKPVPAIISSTQKTQNSMDIEFVNISSIINSSTDIPYIDQTSETPTTQQLATDSNEQSQANKSSILMPPGTPGTTSRVSPDPTPTIPTTTVQTVVTTFVVPPEAKNHNQQNNPTIQQFFADLKMHSAICLVTLLLVILAGVTVFSLALALYFILKFCGECLLKLCKKTRKCIRNRKNSMSSNQNGGSLFPQNDLTIRPYDRNGNERSFY